MLSSLIYSLNFYKLRYIILVLLHKLVKITKNLKDENDKNSKNYCFDFYNGLGMFSITENCFALLIIMLLNKI